MCSRSEFNFEGYSGVSSTYEEGACRRNHACRRSRTFILLRSRRQRAVAGRGEYIEEWSGSLGYTYDLVFLLSLRSLWPASGPRYAAAGRAALS